MGDTTIKLWNFSSGSIQSLSGIVLFNLYANSFLGMIHIKSSEKEIHKVF